MKSYMMLILLICFAFPGWSQETKFYVHTQDTVAINKPFEITFVLENGDGQIEAPEFFGMEVVGGPNYSSSIQIVNGDKNQSISVTYYLVAEEPGEWVVERAMVEVEGVYYETEPKIIVANEKGGTQRPINSRQRLEFSNIWDDFPNMDLFGRTFPRTEKTEIQPDQPKLSKKDSILLQQKARKF